MPEHRAKPRILLAWYNDYHLFGYLKSLLPLLGKYQVTLLTCDMKIVEQNKNNDDIRVVYAPWLRPVMRLMDSKSTRAFGWIFGWIWSFLVSRHYDLIIAPRDTQAFQHMITAWTKALIIRPALGFDDKLYLQHRYGSCTEFPDIMQFTRKKAPIVDSILGGSFLKSVRGNAALKHYTVTGSDIKDLFQELGVPANNIHVTGNPNYEGLLDVISNIPKTDLPKDKRGLALFSSQLRFSKDELRKLTPYLKTIFQNFPDTHLIWKLHPTMHSDDIQALNTWLEQQGFHESVQIIQAFKGDRNNAAIISQCQAVLVEESNVGLLACLQEKPLFIIDLNPNKNSTEKNLFCLFSGVLDCRTEEKFTKNLAILDDQPLQKSTISAQNIMMNKVCKPVVSPCREIVNVIDSMLLKQGV